MSYPKYLSEKNLEKRYRESGIPEDKIIFIKDLCHAAVNLYGTIHAEELWSVYRELSEKSATPFFHKKDLYTILGILRREDLPYYVFEADEVYSEEPRVDKYRVLALKSLIGNGYGKLYFLNSLIDNSFDKPYYVPQDLLSYKEPCENKGEQELIDWLSALKSTETEFETRYTEKKYPCRYTGKRLGEFSFISRDDEFELKYERGEVEGHKGNLKKADELEKEMHSMTAAQRLIHNYTWRSHIGRVTPSESIQYLMDDLSEMGVLLTEKQLEYLVKHLTEFHNHLHLWCNRGWTPEELSKRVFQQGNAIRSIQFGPGMQRAFADGTLDKEELVRQMKEMGIDVL